MTFRAKVNVVGLSLTSILISTSTESGRREPPQNSTLIIQQHYWDCRSGTFPGLLILKKIVLVRWQRDRSVDFLRLFLDAQGSVAAESLSAEASPIQIPTKTVASKWSDKSVSCLPAIAQKSP